MEKESHSHEHVIENSIKDPDQIQSGLARAGDLVAENSSLLGGLVAVILLGWLGYIGFTWWQGKQEAKAQEALYVTQAKILKLKEGFDKSKMDALMPDLSKKDSKADAKDKSAKATGITTGLATGDLAKDYAEMPAELEKTIAQFPKSYSSGEAAITLADLYLEYKQPEKAIGIVTQVASQVPAKSLMSGLLKAMWGKALAQKGECEKAIGIWQQVMDEKAQSFLHADLALKSGICFESLNQFDKARGMYKKASEEFGEYSEGKRTAKSLLRALEVKIKSAQG